jgi:hypothetical protein
MKGEVHSRYVSGSSIHSHTWRRGARITVLNCIFWFAMLLLSSRLSKRA